jgi:serine protease AprX
MMKALSSDVRLRNTLYNLRVLGFGFVAFLCVLLSLENTALCTASLNQQRGSFSSWPIGTLQGNRVPSLTEQHSPPVTPGLRELKTLPRIAPDSTITLWVFLRDKGPSSGTAESVRELERSFSPRALARRAKVRSGPLVDWRDLPVCSEYVRSLRNLGFRIRATSKWLNAVSVRCKAGDRDFLSSLPFVRKIQHVASFPKREIPFEAIPAKPTNTAPSQESSAAAKTPAGSDAAQRPSAAVHVPAGPQSIESQPSESQPNMAPGDTSFYGPTWRQLNLIQAPALHEEGFTGEGMFIGVLDTGFNLTHQALKNVKVVAQWDFINWDSVTANEPGQDSADQHNHGTMILGEIAGNKPGVYMGAAYGADFALAKTEYVPTETPVEEDYWVMGLEWLDSLGVDLVTSSLCYIEWYTYQDMDGNTAVTTIAADMAVANGVSVFNAIGNGGMTSYPYVLAPADGDSVMSIGGVDSLGVLWPQSSRGPTYDGRIKPEVVAQAKEVYVVNPNDSTAYGRVSGTSCSTPVVAGTCALILQKKPGWNPIMLREAVRSTATNASSPDTAIGWGIVRAQDASNYEIISVADNQTPQVKATKVMINVKNVPNPFNPITAIQVELQAPERADPVSWREFDVSNGIPDVTAGIFDITGRCVRNFGRLKFEGNCCAVLWDGSDSSGNPLPSGVYFFIVTSGETLKTRKLVLLR